MSAQFVLKLLLTIVRCDKPITFNINVGKPKTMDRVENK